MVRMNNTSTILDCQLWLRLLIFPQRDAFLEISGGPVKISRFTLNRHLKIDVDSWRIQPNLGEVTTLALLWRQQALYYNILTWILYFGEDFSLFPRCPLGGLAAVSFNNLYWMLSLHNVPTHTLTSGLIRDISSWNYKTLTCIAYIVKGCGLQFAHILLK